MLYNSGVMCLSVCLSRVPRAMAAYATTTPAKRQKFRDKDEYFQCIDKIEYKSAAAAAGTSGASEAPYYRYYNYGERLHSRPIEDWIKASISFTHFKINGSIVQHRAPPPRSWDDGINTVENNKRCLKALFELCHKLGVKYWTAFDTDLVPFRDSWDEMRASWDEMTEYLQEMTQRYQVRLMWLAPDLHSHHRYTYGALSSSDATTFTMAASQIKKCVEMSQRLNSECFLIWPYREGYDSIFQTDVHKEIKLFAKLLKMTAEYKDRLNYRCQLLIMPYYSSFCNTDHWQHCQWRENNLVNVYMWDVTSCLYFLKCHSLDRCYRVCTPPGHHLYLANVYNMLGGVSVTSEVDPWYHRTFTLMMKCILDQGAPPPGGIALQLGPQGADPRDVITSFLKYVDVIARGLRRALNMAAEHMFTRHIQQRYVTYQGGFGSRLVTTDISIEECEEYYKKNHNNHEPIKTEQLQLAFQRYLDASDHV